MHTSQVPTIANIMMRNETWLYNTTRFIRYTSWIYDINVKDFVHNLKPNVLKSQHRFLKIIRI